MLYLHFAAQFSVLPFILSSQTAQVQAGIVRVRHDEGSHFNLFATALAPSSASSTSGSAVTTSADLGGIGSGSSAAPTSKVVPAMNASISLAGQTATVSSSNRTGGMIGIVPAIPNHANSPPLSTIPPISPSKLSAIAAELASMGFGIVPKSANATFTVSASASSTVALQSGSPTSTPSSRVFVSKTTFPLFTNAIPKQNASMVTSTSKPIPAVTGSVSHAIASPLLPSAAASPSSPAQAPQQGPGDQDGPVTITKTTTVTVMPTNGIQASGFGPAASPLAPPNPPGGKGPGGRDPGDTIHPHCRSHSRLNNGTSPATPSAPIPAASGASSTIISASKSAAAATPSTALVVPAAATTGAAKSTLTVQVSQKPSVIVIIPFDPDAPAPTSASSR